MSQTPRRRLLDRIGGTPSLLASGTRLVGDIETPGALMLGGTVQGDGLVNGELSISVEARWQGEVHATSAVVAGQVTGAIIVSERIEIAATAVIRGRVSARSIAMARGATIDGDVVVTSGEAILEFDEKRAPASRPMDSD
ncbi:MAG TPA: polymer-forming cytoskeletal protein [Steroidobacteraceae bacterium]|jgi:cytoskeletal protein CcmA (bactofilin family)